MHIYVMDMIQRRLNINATYVYFSLPPHRGHNLCDGHFARGKQKLRSMVVNDGVKSFHK